MMDKVTCLGYLIEIEIWNLLEHLWSNETLLKWIIKSRIAFKIGSPTHEKKEGFSGEAWKIGLFYWHHQKTLRLFLYEHFFSEIGMQPLFGKGPALGHNINVYLEMKICSNNTYVQG